MTTHAGPPIALAIADPSQPGEARRVAVTRAGHLGFDESGRGKVALVVTEVATNLLKHAGTGELVLQGLDSDGAGGLEILALDRGPGMADVGRCLADGYSTAGSHGNGLGAIARLSALFEIDSHADLGTAVLIRLWAAPPVGNAAAPALEIGAVSLPVAGEIACGDAWSAAESDGRSRLIVADGLGHGPQAADAAQAALRIFHDRADAGPAEIIQAAHLAMRSTRGAALAVAEIDHDRHTVRFAGVGNIAATILGAGRERGTNLVSHNGTVGHEMRKVQEFTAPWPGGSLLIMHSDGLATQWRLERYPGLISRHPSLIAGVLYRDFKRGRDDVTVLAVRDA